MISASLSMNEGNGYGLSLITHLQERKARTRACYPATGLRGISQHLMSKLTKMERKLHAQACVLLEKDVLTYDERWFVAEHWHEGAEHEQGDAGVFFTPLPIASGVAMHATGFHRVIDLCAGIGRLSFSLYCRTLWHDDRP